jgi:hypothetical protein
MSSPSDLWDSLPEKEYWGIRLEAGIGSDRLPFEVRGNFTDSINILETVQVD